MNNPLSALVRSDVLDFKPYSPGLSIDEIKEKFGLDQVIKMASNENPLGVSPVVREVITNYAPYAFRYPAAGNPELCAAIGQYLQVPANRIVCGNGSDEIIDLLIRVTAIPGKNNIVAFNPCFSIYRLQSMLCGVEFRQTGLNPDFSFDWEGLLRIVDDNTRLVFLTNPDNPSGFAASAQEVATLLDKLPDTSFLVIDEAYIDFSIPIEKYSSLSLALNSERVVLLRTFSKMFGLAGLRLGYGLLPEHLADYLHRVRLPFSVNILAEKAGMAALEDTMFRQKTLETIIKGRQFLNSELTKTGCQVYPSQANFIMFRPPMDAMTIFDRLLSRGIIIRPLKSYGLPDCLRVSIGTQKENSIFMDELRNILNAG